MVSTIRYLSFNTLDLGTRRSYRNLILIATVIAAIATHPQLTLVVMAYTYLISGLVGAAISRFHRRGTVDVQPAALPASSPASPAPADTAEHHDTSHDAAQSG
jgi:uncharacterized membrane protein YraQ (UPF0718 family)